MGLITTHQRKYVCFRAICAVQLPLRRSCPFRENDIYSDSSVLPSCGETCIEHCRNHAVRQRSWQAFAVSVEFVYTEDPRRIPCDGTIPTHTTNTDDPRIQALKSGDPLLHTFDVEVSLLAAPEHLRCWFLISDRAENRRVLLFGSRFRGALGAGACENRMNLSEFMLIFFRSNNSAPRRRCSHSGIRCNPPCCSEQTDNIEPTSGLISPDRGAPRLRTHRAGGTNPRVGPRKAAGGYGQSEVQEHRIKPE